MTRLADLLAHDYLASLAGCCDAKEVSSHGQCTQERGDERDASAIHDVYLTITNDHVLLTAFPHLIPAIPTLPF